MYFEQANFSTSLPSRHYRGKTICKFFREGECRATTKCNFSHSAGDSQRPPELCQYYQRGYCRMKANCPHLHGEYPCISFHSGSCLRERCIYSHEPMDTFSQAIFDKIKGNIGTNPSTFQFMPQNTIYPPPVYGVNLEDTKGQILTVPQPGVVLPVLSTTEQIKKEQVIPSSEALSAYRAFFNNSAPLFNSNESQIVPPHPPAGSFVFPSEKQHKNFSFVSQDNAAVSTFNFSQSQASDLYSESNSSQFLDNKNLVPIMKQQIIEKQEIKTKKVISGHFNVEDMLAKITGAPIKDEIQEESPASPIYLDLKDNGTTKIIPLLDTIWQIYPVDEEDNRIMEFDDATIQKLLDANPSQSDPRVQKILYDRLRKEHQYMLELAQQQQQIVTPVSLLSSPIATNNCQLIKEENFYNSQDCFMETNNHCENPTTTAETSNICVNYDGTNDNTPKWSPKEKTFWIKKDNSLLNCNNESMDFSNDYKNSEEIKDKKNCKASKGVNKFEWDQSVALLPTPKERLKNCNGREPRLPRNNFKRHGRESKISPEKRRSGKHSRRGRPRRRLIVSSDEEDLKPVDLSDDDGDETPVGKLSSRSPRKYSKKKDIEKKDKKENFSQMFQVQIDMAKQFVRKKSPRSKPSNRSNKRNYSKSSSSQDLD